MVAGALLPVTFRALSADEEHSNDHIRVVVGVGRACMCVGERGEQCRWGGGGLLPAPACHQEGDRKDKGAGLGTGTTASKAPPEHPGNNLRKRVLWAFRSNAHRGH